MSGVFSVYQYFPDGTHEEVRRFVDAEEAVKAAKHYSSSPGALLGTTVRVVITDGDDFLTFDWVRGQGVVFPPAADGQH